MHLPTVTHALILVGPIPPVDKSSLARIAKVVQAHVEQNSQGELVVTAGVQRVLEVVSILHPDQVVACMPWQSCLN